MIRGDGTSRSTRFTGSWTSVGRYPLRRRQEQLRKARSYWIGFMLEREIGRLQDRLELEERAESTIREERDRLLWELKEERAERRRLQERLGIESSRGGGGCSEDRRTYD
jgi:hypothetical protein